MKQDTIENVSQPKKNIILSFKKKTHLKKLFSADATTFF